jgi:excinuclease UvrABC nuclease subunit
MSDVEAEARRILDLLVSIPFESCYLLSRNLTHQLNRKPSIYAVKHRTQGLLYIGKAKYPKERFKDGHKAFFWSWLERYDPDDVRLIVVALSHSQWAQLLLDIEAIILQASKPPYNVQIPMRD